jgi:hypothetical protein
MAKGDGQRLLHDLTNAARSCTGLLQLPTWQLQQAHVHGADPSLGGHDPDSVVPFRVKRSSASSWCPQVCKVRTRRIGPRDGPHRPVMQTQLILSLAPPHRRSRVLQRFAARPRRCGGEPLKHLQAFIR